MINISVSGDGAADELRSLLQWLRDDPDIRHDALISLSSDLPEPGKMGASFEAIKMVLDEGFQVGNFALAFASWYSTRRNHRTVTIERDGIKVTIDGADPEMAAKIYSAIGKVES
ncbi:hypothetical protein NE235_28770 [Actinoallomurus spadix]|nr:hypothetical protein [Actinoallomurus spadix]MCO5990114.1 hypothetical protein [Actinoallomurus spadix]